MRVYDDGLWNGDPRDGEIVELEVIPGGGEVGVREMRYGPDVEEPDEYVYVVARVRQGSRGPRVATVDAEDPELPSWLPGDWIDDVIAFCERREVMA